MVAYELGNEYDKKSMVPEALAYFKEAEDLFPLGSWKKKALDAQQRLKQEAAQGKAIDHVRLAKYMVDEFARLVGPEYTDYFERLGFTRANILDPSVLFKFMSIISYDMRPLGYQQVWGPPNHAEFDGNSIKQSLEKLRIDYCSVREMDQDNLRDKLRDTAIIVRGEPFKMDSTAHIDHARGLKELASRTENICELLRSLERTGNVQGLSECIDSVHGFGEALTSKTILFIVRCFGIGFSLVRPQDLKPIAKGILTELRMAQRINRLRRLSVNIDLLMEHLTELGDPYAIELLYLLDTEEGWKRLLQNT
jgi:hypothetical protein